LRKAFYLCTLIQKSKKGFAMKKDIHPQSYRTVVFKDFSCDESWLGRSCAPSRDSVVWEDGTEYPLIKLEISSASHPFFTGKMKFVDTAGRIDKFNKKFAKFVQKP
jgi:large subunit ribosomal protein L31